MIDTAIEELAPLVGVTAAGAAVGRPRAWHQRAHPVTPRPPAVAVASSSLRVTRRPPLERAAPGYG